MQEMARTTHYAVLGVAEDADYAQIRCSYLSCLLALHPDKQQQQQEDPLSSSRFLRLQEAWDVLRDPQFRSSYDHHLASSRLLLAPAVAEDVLFEEMSTDCDDPTSYVYPCRCGDFFAVSLQELDELGFREKLQNLGFDRSVASMDEQTHSTCLQSSNTSNQDFLRQEPTPRSLVLPCGSCSLRIHLLC